MQPFKNTIFKAKTYVMLYVTKLKKNHFCFGRSSIPFLLYWIKRVWIDQKSKQTSLKYFQPIKRETVKNSYSPPIAKNIYGLQKAKNIYGLQMAKNSYGPQMAKNIYVPQMAKNSYGSPMAKNSYGP